MPHVLELCASISPLALVTEVRARPWDLWRPSYLVHQWGSRMRILWLEDPVALDYAKQLHRWSWQRSDQAVLAGWLRSLRECTPTRGPADHRIADAATEVAAMALSLADTPMAIEVIRGGLVRHAGDERLRVMEIEALWAHGELSSLERDFALAALPLTDGWARRRAEMLRPRRVPAARPAAC